MPKINLDRLREKIDIVEIIGEYVSLKQKNHEHTGLCPFHSEKSPSFTVNAPKGVFFCFGCGERGDAIAFLMTLNKTNFLDTVTSLAERYEIPIEAENDESLALWREKTKLKKQLIEVNEAACVFFTNSMCDRSRSYLEQRHIDLATSQKFRLGYAPDDWQKLVNNLSEHYDRSLLIQAGLVGNKGDRYYDLFRDRLMVPLSNPQGEVVGFSGRGVSDEIKPKYLNTPDTEVFKKSEVIFPLHLAREAIFKQDSAIVVEGNFDVIRLHQIGIVNAIATLGTAIDKRQLNRLAGLTQNNTLTLALDNDPPGIKATDKIIDTHLDAIGSGLINFKVLSLPTGFKDVDEVINTPNGTVAIQGLLKDAPLWVDWRLDRILATYSLDDAEQFNLGKKAIANLLGQIQDPSLKSFYLAKCSEILSRGNLSPEIIALHRQGLSSTAKERQTHKISHKISHDDGLLPQEAKVLSCELTLAKTAIFHPEYSPHVANRLEEISWFVRDPLCRWSINRVLKEPLASEYVYQNVRADLECLLNSPDLFGEEVEFLNLDFKRDRASIQSKINKLFSQSEAEMLSLLNTESNINSAIEQLSKIKIQEKINVLEVMLGSTSDLTEQTKYLQEISSLKCQLLKK